MRLVFWAGLVGACACSTGDSAPVVSASECEIQGLPLSGAPGAPVVSDVGLEVQSSGIVPVATATDPQGDDDLRNVTQSLGVYPDNRCEGAPITVQDDLAGGGLEETFGTAIPATDSVVYRAITASTAGWPVRVEFTDASGNRTSGDVLARIIR